jgi:hypothetical protein
MVRAWHGRGLASVNQTRPHCVNQKGKTHSKPVAARHGRGTAWARHATCESAFSFPTTVLLHEFSGGKDYGTPLHAKKALKKGTGIAVLLHASSALVGGQRNAPALLPPRRDPVPTEQEARCASGTVGMGPDNLASTGVRTPDRPARSDSLHRLRHPGRLLRDRLHLK